MTSMITYWFSSPFLCLFLLPLPTFPFSLSFISLFSHPQPNSGRWRKREREDRNVRQKRNTECKLMARGKRLVCNNLERYRNYFPNTPPPSRFPHYVLLMSPSQKAPCRATWTMTWALPVTHSVLVFVCIPHILQQSTDIQISASG